MFAQHDVMGWLDKTGVQPVGPTVGTTSSVTTLTKADW